MKEKEIFVVVGKIGATYGIHGWLKINSFTEDFMKILDYFPWFIQQNNQWQPAHVIEARQYGKGIIANFSGHKNPEQAKLWTGKLIAVERAQLPKLKKNEYYWSDLEGLTVVNQMGNVLGKIIYLMETGSNDVLVIKGDKEIAIPYLPGDVVKDIDLSKQIMTVDWE